MMWEVPKNDVEFAENTRGGLSKGKKGGGGCYFEKKTMIQPVKLDPREPLNLKGRAVFFDGGE